jgi:hypothetical protein
VLLAEVDSFRAVRVQLRDVPPPAALRERVLAAALAEFDALTPAVVPAGAAAAAPPAAPPAVAAVVPLSSRWRWPQAVLSAAAAVLVVGIVGVVIRNGSTSSGSKSVATVAGGQADQTTAAAGAPTPTIGAINGPADARQRLSTLDQLRALPDPFSAPTAGAAPSSLVDVGNSTVTSAAPSTVTAAVASTTVPAPESSRHIEGLACPLGEHDVALAPILWQEQPAWAVRDSVTRVTRVLDAQCNVLATANP